MTAAIILAISTVAVGIIVLAMAVRGVTNEQIAFDRLLQEDVRRLRKGRLD